MGKEIRKLVGNEYIFNCLNGFAGFREGNSAREKCVKNEIMVENIELSLILL